MPYVVGQSATIWVMLVADDYHLETSGAAYRTGLITFFVICSLPGVPLSCGKTSGEVTLTWVGFELLRKSSRLGISRRRSEWFCRWCEETATAEKINTSSFEEGLLEHERAFLSPLVQFLALHPRGSGRRVLGYVRFILKYLASEVAKCRHFDSAMELGDNLGAIRVDAQASDLRIHTEGLGRSPGTQVETQRKSSRTLIKDHSNSHHH